MNKAITILLMLLTLTAFGQKNPTEEAQPIVAEGKLLYRSEMASWNGTDLFLESYKNRENIGGYFSYSVGDSAKCVFFSIAENPKIIGTISFDSSYNLRKAKIDLTERDFTESENDLYEIRKIALTELQTNKDGLFEFYQNTSPNLIPIINNQIKKVYILTGPKQSGVIILGNDYLLTFDESNKLVTTKQLHKNIISFDYGNVDDSEKIEGAMHTHLPETGNFITATDICTLMLYAKYANWKTHNVVSEKYLNIWNCEKNNLLVVPMNSFNKDQEKRKKKEKK